MNFKTLFMPIALSGFIGLSNSDSGQQKLREWLIYMHAEQVKLLKINWGNPGLCTEWDRDFQKASNSVVVAESLPKGKALSKSFKFV